MGAYDDIFADTGSSEWDQRSDQYRADLPKAAGETLNLLNQELQGETDPANVAALQREIARAQQVAGPASAPAAAPSPARGVYDDLFEETATPISTAPLASQKPSTVNIPGSVMNGVQATPAAQSDPALSMVTEGFKASLNERMANSTPEQRARLVAAPGMIGRVARMLDQASTLPMAPKPVTAGDQRRQMAQDNPKLAALAAGSAQTMQGMLDAVPLAADAVNQYAVNPFLRAAGAQPMGPSARLPGAAYLQQAGEDFTPDAVKQSLSDAWETDQFGSWLATNMAQQAPQLVSSTAAAFVPPLRTPYLLSMGAQSGGRQYQQNKEDGVAQSQAITNALVNGNIEVLSEMLPLGVFDRVSAYVARLSAPAQRAFMTEVAKRIATAGTALTTQMATGAIEEAVAQVGQNLSDNSITGKDTSILDGAPEAAVIGAASGGLMGARHAVRAGSARSPESEIANAIDQEVARAQFAVPSDTVARDAMNPANAQIRPAPQIDPVEQADRMRAEQQATDRADLSTVLNDPRPMDEIQAERDQQAAEQAAQEAAVQQQAKEQQQAELAAAAEQFGLPAVNARTIMTLPGGNQVAGAVIDQYDDEGTPVVRVMGDDGQQYDLSADDAQFRPEPVGTGQQAAPVVVERTEDIQIAERQVETAPTEAQKLAGNYAMGHVKLQGLDVTIENPAGSTRTGVDKNGKPWSSQIAHTYGYIKGSTAKDGDHLDVFLGPDAAEGQSVFVVDQIDPDTGRYDEAKILLGFSDGQAALEGYLSNYEQGWRGAGAMTEMSMPEFKAWLAKGNTKKPLRYKKPRKQPAAPVQSTSEAQDGRQENRQDRPQNPLPGAQARRAANAQGAAPVPAAGSGNALPVRTDGNAAPEAGLIPDGAKVVGRYTQQQSASDLAASLKAENPANDYAVVERKGSAFSWFFVTQAPAAKPTVKESLPVAEAAKPASAPTSQQAQFNTRADANAAMLEAAEATGKVHEVVELENGKFEIRAAVEPAQEDRRKDSARRKAVAEMSQEEMRRALLTDDLTWLGNRRAYNESKKKAIQSSIDIDSLKWVNDNLGHDAGDKLIQSLGQALRDENVDAYHLSGDEFSAQFDNEADGHAALARVRDRLKNAVIRAIAPDGTVITKTGVEFSYGLATNIKDADTRLREDKAAREAAGQRAGRGAEPAGVGKETPAGQQDTGRDTAAEEVTNSITVYRGRQKGATDKPATWWTSDRTLAEHFSKFTPKSGNKTVDTGEIVEESIDRAGVLDTKWHAYDIKTIGELATVSGVDMDKFVQALASSDNKMDQDLAKAGDAPWRAHVILERAPVQRVLREAGFTHLQAIEGKKGEGADTFLKLPEPEKSTITPDVKKAAEKKDIADDWEKAKQIIHDAAKARPFDNYDAVRDDVLAQIKKQTGKNLSDFEESRGSMMRDPLSESIHDGQYEGMQDYASTLPVRISESAIPMESAVRAFSGTSFSPEKRGASARRSYFREVMGLWRRFEKDYNAAPEDRRTAFVDAFNDAASRYAGLTNAYLSSHSNVMSAMIAGPAKFPTERNRKRSDAADKRAAEANEYLGKATKRLAKVLAGPVDNSLSSELVQAEKKLADREKTQDQYKAINAALRKGDDAALRAIGISDAAIAELKKPDFAGRTGIADYQLKNNNAEIRRLRGRVEELKRRAADAAESNSEQQETEAAGVRMVRNAEANRLQLFFDGKPEDQIREKLKGAGFRWAPSTGAWQRQLTDNAVAAAERIMKDVAPSSDTSTDDLLGDISSDMIDIDGVMRHRNNSEGNPISYTTAGLRDFWKWFGDSKVVDAKGRPMPVYHGTPNQFDTFEPSESGFYGEGIYFIDDRQEAQQFGDDAGDGDGETRVIGAYLKSERPYLFDAPPASEEPSNVTFARELFEDGDELDSLIDKMNGRGWYNPTTEFSAELESMGHDGLIARAFNGPAEYIVFNPAQIKSVDNIGTWRGDDPRIMYDAGPRATSPQRAFDLGLYAAIASGTSSRDILARIASESTSENNRELAQALIDAGISPKIEIGLAKDSMFTLKDIPDGYSYAAGYSPGSDVVLLYKSVDAEKHIMHEFVHAASYKALRRGGPIAAQMKRLYLHVQNDGGANGAYGMSNYDEFTAEALSNPEFQDTLRAITAMPADSKFKNVWDWFVDLVRRVLKLPTQNTNALEQAMRYGRGLMDENLDDAPRGEELMADIAPDSDDSIRTASDLAKQAQRTTGGERLENDLGLVSKYLSFPRAMAAYSRDMAKVYHHQNLQFQKRDIINAELTKIIKPYSELTDAQKKRVNIVLELGRHNKTVYGRGDKPVKVENDLGPLELSKMGDEVTLTDAEKSGYWAVRRTMDRALTRYKEQFIREYGFDPEKVKSANDVLALIKPEMTDSEKKRFETIAEIVAEIEQARRRGYVPFTRYGEVGISVRDANRPDWEGKPDLLHFEKVEVLSPLDRIKRRIAGGEDVERNAKVRARMAELQKRYPGMKISARKMEISENTDVSLSEIDNLAAYAGMTGEQWQDVHDKLALAVKTKGFRRHFINAKETMGYSGDMERGLSDYIIGMSSYLARREHTPDVQEALKNIPQTADFKEIKKYAKKYVDDANNPAEELARTRQLMFIYYIAGNVSSAMVNMTQPILTASYLTQFSSAAQVSLHMARAYKDVLGMLPASSVAAGAATGAVAGTLSGNAIIGMAAGGLVTNFAAAVKNGLDVFDFSKAPADVKEVLDEALARGLLVPLDTHENLAAAHNRNAGLRHLSKNTRTAVEIAALTFSTAERVNRLVTFIAASRLARQPGFEARARKVLANDKLAQVELFGKTKQSLAFHFGEWVNDETNFKMGKLNRSTIMRHGAAQLLLQFKSFGMHMFQLLSRLVRLNGAQGKKAAGMILATIAFLSGVWGLPGVDAMRELYEAAHQGMTHVDFDVKSEAQQALTEITGDTRFGQFVNFGIGDMIGIDLSARLGMQGLIPTEASDLMGIPGAFFIDRTTNAATYLGQERFGLAAAQALPNAGGNVISGVVMGSEGVKTKFGKTILPAEKIEPADQVKKAFGFTSSGIKTVREREYAVQRMQRATDDYRRDLYSRAANIGAAAERAKKRGDAELVEKLDLDRKKLDDEVDKFNADHPDNEIRLNERTINKKIDRDLEGYEAKGGLGPKASRDEAERIRQAFGGR